MLFLMTSQEKLYVKTVSYPSRYFKSKFDKFQNNLNFSLKGGHTSFTPVRFKPLTYHNAVNKAVKNMIINNNYC